MARRDDEFKIEVLVDNTEIKLLRQTMEELTKAVKMGARLYNMETPPTGAGEGASTAPGGQPRSSQYDSGGFDWATRQGRAYNPNARGGPASQDFLFDPRVYTVDPADLKKRAEESHERMHQKIPGNEYGKMFRGAMSALSAGQGIGPGGWGFGMPTQKGLNDFLLGQSKGFRGGMHGLSHFLSFAAHDIGGFDEWGRGIPMVGREDIEAYGGFDKFLNDAKMQGMNKAQAKRWKDWWKENDGSKFEAHGDVYSKAPYASMISSMAMRDGKVFGMAPSHLLKGASIVSGANAAVGVGSKLVGAAGKAIDELYALPLAARPMGYGTPETQDMYPLDIFQSGSATQNMVRRHYEGLKARFSPFTNKEDVDEIRGSLEKAGYGNKGWQNQYNQLFDLMINAKQETGLSGNTQTQMLDQYFRIGGGSIQGFAQVLKSIPEAANAARMTTEQYAQSLMAGAQAMRGNGRSIPQNMTAYASIMASGQTEEAAQLTATNDILPLMAAAKSGKSYGAFLNSDTYGEDVSKAQYDILTGMLGPIGKDGPTTAQLEQLSVLDKAGILKTYGMTREGAIDKMTNPEKSNMLAVLTDRQGSIREAPNGESKIKGTKKDKFGRKHDVSGEAIQYNGRAMTIGSAGDYSGNKAIWEDLQDEVSAAYGGDEKQIEKTRNKILRAKDASQLKEAISKVTEEGGKDLAKEQDDYSAMIDLSPDAKELFRLVKKNNGNYRATPAPTSS